MKKGVGRAVGAGSAANRAVPNGVLALALLVAAADLAAQGALGNGQLQIIGTGLDVSPEAQTVPIGVPTRIDTRLPLAPGVHLPPSVSVRGELNGPGLLSTLSLTAEPNGFFSIPAQTVRGTYTLTDIRLVDGDSLVAYSAHRDATVTVTDILVTQVTSRPLTYQEMVDKGIVISQKDFRGYNFSFAVTIESNVVTFDVPIVFPGTGPPILPTIPRPQGQTPPPESFPIPQVHDIQLKCTGFCPSGQDPGDFPKDEGVTVSLPGLLVIPGDVAFLNQFFSVLLLVQNGAPQGSPLRLEGITAKATLPAGLRAAETNPPTNLADPVPVVDPGPDGKVGTADDVTFLLAQGVGKAEFLVEGLKAGSYEVPIDLSATLQGLPTGPMTLQGSTSGVVLVRNPSFFVTLDHPDVVREREFYTLSATVANTSNVPANQVSIKLDRASISGADLLSNDTVSLGDIAPGDSALAKFQMKALRTGRATSTAFIGEGALAGAIVLSAGIGELSIPLSPDTLVYPKSVDALPVDLVDPAKRLIGLAWSLAHSSGSPPPAGLAPVGEQATRWRIDDLIRASRHVDLGEPDSAALSDMMLAWLNAGPEVSLGFDQLRRSSVKGREFAAAWQGQLSRFWENEDPFVFQRRIARSLSDRSFLSADLTAGSDPANPAARLVVVGKAIPGRAQLFAEEDGFERSLSSAELFRADQGGVHHEVAWVGNLDSNGYQIQISGKSADNVTLSVTFPGAGGKLVSAVVGPFPVIPGSIAFVDVFNGTDQTTWTLNGTNFTPMSGATQIDPRPELTLIKAVQDLEADPRGHALSLLFNRALQDEPNRDPLKYQVRSEFGINPIQAVLPQAFDPRRVILGVTNHPSPYASIVASVTGLIDASGQPVAPDPQTATLDVRDRTPGGAVEGFVIGADGQPVPNAEVILRMPAISDITGQTFLDDFAAAKADGSGHFFFEYIPIRQGTVFTLAAADPVTGYDGDAAGQIQTEGQKLQLNIVLLARGDVTGKVVDENGAPIPNAFITADSVFFKGGRNSATGNSAPDGTYLFTAMPVGPVQLWAIDPASRKTAYQVAFIPAAGAKAVQNLVIVAGARASVSGQVILERDRSPAVGVYVVTYGETVAVPYPPFFDRKYLGYRITDSNGAFAFNDIQPGQDTIQVFDFTRSLSAVVAKDVTVLADSQTVLQLVIPEPEAHVGSVAGFIRSSKSGVVTPLANAVVYVSGTPARTTTDAQGHYQLDGVPIGSRGVSAYNPATQKFVSGNALIQEGLIASLDLLFVTTANISGLVVDPLNRFVPNAAVAEFDAAGNVAHGTTADANGRFVFEGLSPGGHTFYAFAKDDTSGKLQDDIGAATINFVGDQDASIVISLLGYGSIHGKVVSTQLGQDGQPIDSPVAAHLTLQPPKLLKVGGFALIVDPASELYPGPDETDSLATDGTYSFASVLGGRFVLKAHHPLFGDQAVVGSITRAGQIFTQDFHFQGLSSIDGYLYDPNGNPIAGVPVDLWIGNAPATRDDPLRPPFATVQTVSDPSDPRGLGYFRFAAVGNGDYAVAFEGGVNGIFRFDEALVSVSGPPHPVRVTLRARQVQDVRVHVFEPDSQDVPQPVALASVSIRETDWPFRSFGADTTSDGTVLFPGISQGRFTINAQSLSQKGSAGGCVCEDGGATDITVLLSGSGSVTGTVRFPGTGAAVASAQVLVLDLGIPVGAAQTDANGLYRIEGLALNRLFTIHVKDNASARFGFSPAFLISDNGDEVVEDVTLLALGFVNGTFSDTTGAQPIAGATVTLTSNSLLGFFRFLSGTDGQGQFTFGGIPQGTFSAVAQDTITRLSGSGSGSIDSEGQTVTLDLRAQANGTVQGTVLDSAGAPLAVAPVVTLTAPGLEAQTVFSSSFSFVHIPVGVVFTVTAEEQVSPPRHRALATGMISSNGEIQTLELRYVPYGNVNVHVVRVALDGSQTTADRGGVSILNLGVYGNQFPFGYQQPIDAQGNASFTRVGGGPIRAIYLDPVNRTIYTEDGTLTAEGSTIDITVEVFNTSAVSGRILKPAPASTDPAPGSFVTLITGNVGRTVVTGDDGRFSFAGVPFQPNRIEVHNDALPGRAIRSFTLSSANSPLDLGDLVLDGTPPFVGLFSPPAGSTGISRTAVITVIFSEPVTITNTASFQALALDHIRTGRISLAGDRRTATWTAEPPLLPNTAYTFRVGVDAVVDDAGWGLASPNTSTLTTVNDAGPSVVQTVPVANATQVPVLTSLVAVFDIDLDPASVVTGAFLLEKTVPTAADIAGTVSVGANARTVVFTPTTPLDSESQYRATLAGLKSTNGTAMFAPYSFTFWTQDNTAPSVTFDSPPASPLITNTTYTFSLSWTSPDVRSIAVGVNGLPITTLSPRLGARTASFSYFVGSDASTRIFTAVPTDFSGNVGSAAALTVPVSVDAPPAVAIQLTSPTVLSSGQPLTGRVVAADDRGLSTLRLYVSGPFSAFVQWTDVMGQTSVSRDFNLVVPVSAAVGGVLTLKADATDDNPLHQLASATNALISISRDTVPPVVANVIPASGTTVLPGSQVQVAADITDNLGVQRVSLDQAGSRVVTQSGNRFTLLFTAPTGTADFTATLTALDWGGNAASAPILFHLAADQPPTGTLAFSPPGPFLPNSFLYVQIDAQDDHALRDVFLHFTGAVTDNRLLQLSGTSSSLSWQEKVPQNAAPGATISVSADIRDQQGHTTTVGPVSTTVASDVTPPVISNARPLDGSKFISGNLVSVGVDAVDDVAVASVDIVVDGATTTVSQPPFQITYKAKTVSADTVVPIHFAARDLAGNAATLDRSVTISPLANPNAPTVNFLCPTSGALAPAGYTLTVSAAATDDQAVEHVEFSADDGPPFASISSAPYTASFTIAAAAAPGSVVHLRARAFDFAGNVGIADADVTVIAGTIIFSDTAIFVGTTTYDGQTLILTGGTTTIAGTHPFADVIVLAGARLTSDPSTAFTTSQLDLSQVTGRVYVGCGGAIDVTGKGFLGGWQTGNPSASGLTVGNVAGSAFNTAGSYGGLGGVTNHGSSGALASTYGDLKNPSLPGGGGGGSESCCFAGGSGGGVTRITASSVVVDGAIAARGGIASQSGGSGGSIRIDSSTLSGAGTIDASGGSGGTGGPEFGGGGGGGRVAIYGDAAGFDRSHLIVHGGATQDATTGSQSGGAGTVYLKGPVATDGELLLDNGGVPNAAQTRLVPLGSAYRFDAVTALNRSKGVSTDDVVSTFNVDATSYFATPSRDAAPTVTVTTTPAGTVPSSSNLTITVTTQDDNALGKIDLAVAGNPSFSETRKETDVASKTETYTLFIPNTTPAGTLDITATVTDEPFARTATATTSVTVDADFPPTGTLSFDAGGPFLPGKNVTITVAAADDKGLSFLNLIGSSTLVFFNQNFALSGTTATKTYTFMIPLAAPAGHQISVTATIRDTKNQTVTLNGAITVAADVTAPVISNPRPANGASFRSGDQVAVGVDVTDDVAVASVDISVDGVTTTVTSAPYQITYAAKSVTTPTSVPIQFVARDSAGNSSTLSETITVNPTVDPGIPKVSWACPTSGAILPAGVPFTIIANASDDQAVQKVEFYADAATTPFATDTAAPYQATFTIPSSLTDGATVTLRAKVYDFANNTAEASTVVTVVEGDVIPASATIAAADTSHDGHTLIITGGTTTIDGPHSFTRLVVLSGAKIAQLAATPVAVKSVNITIPSGTVYVACGGSIDVSAKGFAAGQTWTGVSAPCQFGGGAYGGSGGSCTGTTYGSLFDPMEPGSGGGPNIGGGGVGGGLVRLTAGRMILDGTLAADGGSANTGAAGGGIRLDVVRLSGSGSAHAVGGVTGLQFNGSGGGGRIAIFYSDISGFDVSHLAANGGGAGAPGTAGTILLKSSSQTYGELILDNAGTNTLTSTPVPSIGTGTVSSVSGSTFTKSSGTFPYSVEGISVDIRRAGALVGRFRAVSSSGATLTVETPIQGLVQSGDTFRGVLKLDNLVIRNGARLSTQDFVEGFDNPPTATISTTTPNPILPGKNIGISVAAVDDYGLATVVLRSTGAVMFNQSRSVSGVTSTPSFGVPVPLTAVAGSTVQIFTDVTDTAGQTATFGPFVVTIAADTVAPTLSNPTPADGSSFASTKSITVGVTAADNVGIQSVDISVDGVVTTRTSAPYQITYVAKTVSAPTSVPIRFVAHDYAGNTAEIDESITVHPDQPPTLALCPSDGAVYVAGFNLTVLANVADDVGVTKVEFYLNTDTTPFATDTFPPFQTTYAVPASLAVGDTFTLRARAYDTGGQTADAQSTVTIVTGDIISASTTIASGDASHDGNTLIIAGGTTTIDGPHTFARLIVLSGATVAPVPATISSQGLVTLTSTGDVYVACGGAIDASAQGFLGAFKPGNPAFSGRTFGNLPGSTGSSGGSNGGLGGRSSPAPIYGNLFDPRDAGGGGGAIFSGNQGGNGGGVVRLAGGNVRVDGSILSNGGFSSISGGGAGGSIRLDVTGLQGSGLVSASAVPTGDGPGGGGRVAVYSSGGAVAQSLLRAAGWLYDDFDPFNPTIYVSGPGSIFVKSDSESYGELTFDNLSQPGGPTTTILSIGTGTITSVSGSTFTDSTKSFKYSVAGLFVEVTRAGTTIGTYRVLDQNGGTLTLDTSIAGVVQTGDTYQGILKLDAITVKGSSKVSTADRLDCPSITVETQSGSSLTAANYP